MNWNPGRRWTSLPRWSWLLYIIVYPTTGNWWSHSQGMHCYVRVTTNGRCSSWLFHFSLFFYYSDDPLIKTKNHTTKASLRISLTLRTLKRPFESVQLGALVFPLCINPLSSDFFDYTDPGVVQEPTYNKLGDCNSFIKNFCSVWSMIILSYRWFDVLTQTISRHGKVPRRHVVANNG